ncbi:MAG TPA: right-handed parallel beta-helix repeat-containing protein [Phycisphaerales bacterium]|nr:right-handed parallel beta-helix repeat-containing protein [Phycisphaerales bacterium]
MTRHACSIILTLVACAGATHAAVINVPADQPTIQAAITAAVNGDEIVVAPGTYSEQLDFLGKQIVVRSSAGASSTIISGGGTVAPLVQFTTGETAATRLQGFTLREATSAVSQGGALQIATASPTIADCIITTNTLTGSGTGAGANIVDATPTFLRTIFADNTSDGVGGSALYIAGASNVTVTECTFTNNEDVNAAGNPGAISVATSTLTVNNSIFIGNDAGGGGLGGAINADASTVIITGGRFENNAATDGGSGGAIYSFDGDLTVTNAVFVGNQGGAIFNDGGTAIITASVFEENINEGGSGGGVSISGGSGVITGSTFIRNQAIGGAGGGVGVDSFLTPADITITDCTFIENETPGGSGAAFYAEGSLFATVPPISGVIDRCTFIDNGLLDDPNNGGSGSTVELRRRVDLLFTSSLLAGNIGASGSVALSNTARAEFVNCTLVDNVPDPSSRTFSLPATAVLRVRNSIVRGDTSQNRRMFPASLPAAALTVEHSNVSGGYAGVGNINLDPGFVDTVSGDYRLTASSPSVDAGDNAFVPTSSVLDLDGTARIAGPAVDMGAYEQGGASACDDIDFNNNGVFPEDQDVVDFFNVLAGAECPSCNDIDFNNNAVFPEDQDVVDFFNVLAGGDC